MQKRLLEKKFYPNVLEAGWADSPSQRQLVAGVPVLRAACLAWRPLAAQQTNDVLRKIRPRPNTGCQEAICSKPDRSYPDLPFRFDRSNVSSIILGFMLDHFLSFFSCYFQKIFSSFLNSDFVFYDLLKKRNLDTNS